MPKLVNTPVALRPFIFHGVRLDWQGKEQAIGDCPFCSHDGKFYVNPATSKWDCKSCGASGNAATFLKQLWEASEESTDIDSLKSFASNRVPIRYCALADWGVRQSVVSGEWIVPGYNSKGTLCQLYKYAYSAAAGRAFLWPTPNYRGLVETKGGTDVVDYADAISAGQQLFGVSLFDKTCHTVYVCEGPWDGMALWQCLRSVKPDTAPPGELVRTSNLAASLLSGCSVIAVPSCSIFKQPWAQLLAGRRVVLMYDNDHPQKDESTSRIKPPSGLDGMKRVARILSTLDRSLRPASLYYLKWGPRGYNTAYPHGYDVRDFLSGSLDAIDRMSTRDVITEQGRLAQTLTKKMICEVPQEWIVGKEVANRLSTGGQPSSNGQVGSNLDLPCKPCNQWADLVESLGKALYLTDGLVRAYAVMLACVASTDALGDQLWVKIIGPPSSGKSTLCMAITVSRKYTEAESNITGFHSGSKDGHRDNSLIARTLGKTLVTKDGDTLTKLPNVEQIMAEARDIYDGSSQAYYRNGIHRDYQGLRITWILCGTSDLYNLDDSQLGERMLTCVIMRVIDSLTEDAAAAKALDAMERNLRLSSNCKPESRHSPEVLGFMMLTGGYVNHLRDNARTELGKMRIDRKEKDLCGTLGKFVAYMRASPSEDNPEHGREYNPRLASQFLRLATCLAVVFNKTELDNQVMDVVRQVALDTCNQTSLIIATVLRKSPDGLSNAKLLEAVGQPFSKEWSSRLTFLKKIGVIETFISDLVGMAVSSRTKLHWRLTSDLTDLYDKVYNWSC